MPTIEVTREELEDLISCVMESRCDNFGHSPTETLSRLPDLHLKLENALELWINGGAVQLPIPETLKNKGVVGYERVYPPHDEGCDRHGD